MKMRIQKAGHLVDEAVNGEQALEMMKWRKYDAVLMDLQMPVMVSDYGLCYSITLTRLHHSLLTVMVSD